MSARFVSSLRPIPRRDRLLHERFSDAYALCRKHGEPVHCPNCGAVFRDGRWRQGSPGMESMAVRCGACRRAHDDCPAGVLTLAGGFATRHRDEIFHLIQHQEALERHQYPLHRIMGIAEKSEQIAISTTDIHLPRRLGKALKRAYGGDLAVQHGEGGSFVRVHWRRDS